MSLDAKENGCYLRLELETRDAAQIAEIHTRLTEAEVRKAALAAYMCLSFYSDYSHNTEENKGCTLVINYAAIEADKIAAVIERLSSLFPECNQIS